MMYSLPVSCFYACILTLYRCTFSACSQVIHNINGISVYTFLFPFQDTADLEEEAVHNYPFIFRTESAEQCQYHIMVERELLIISDDLVGAVIDLFSAYYVFNIAYPKPLYPVLVFLQHYILGIKDSQRIPNSVNVFISNTRTL